MITNARWTDETRSEITAMVDGKPATIPADPTNRHYADIVRLEIDIAPPVAMAVPE